MLEAFLQNASSRFISLSETGAVYIGIYSSSSLSQLPNQIYKALPSFINVYQAGQEDLKSSDLQILALKCFHQVFHTVIHFSLLFMGKVQGQTLSHLNELVNYLKFGCVFRFQVSIFKQTCSNKKKKKAVVFKEKDDNKRNIVLFE